MIILSGIYKTPTTNPADYKNLDRMMHQTFHLYRNAIVECKKI
jgi:hypothetical protein